METKGEIAYTKDIIDQMEKVLDMPREKIEINVKYMIRAMYIRAEEVECGTMYIRGLGTKYFRVNTVRRILEGCQKAGTPLAAKMTKYKEKVYRLLAIMPRSTGIPQMRIERRLSTVMNRNLDSQGIEEFQNKKYNEFEERKKHS